MLLLIKIFLNVLIVGLFLYAKLLPYKDRLDGQYKSLFNFFSAIFTPLFGALKNVAKPFRVGQGISVDMTQIIILLLLLLVNMIIR